MKWTKNESGNIRLAFWYTHKYHWMHMISIFFHNVSLSPVLNDDTRCSEQTNGTCLIRMNNICIDSLELLVAIFSPGSIRWAHTHTFIIILHLLFHPSYLLGIFSGNLNTHTYPQMRRSIDCEAQRTKTNGYKAHTCFNFPFLQNGSLSLSLPQSHSRFLSILSVDRYRSLPTIELMHVYATLCCVCSWA